MDKAQPYPSVRIDPNIFLSALLARRRSKKFEKIVGSAADTKLARSGAAYHKMIPFDRVDSVFLDDVDDLDGSSLVGQGEAMLREGQLPLPSLKPPAVDLLKGNHGRADPETSCRLPVFASYRDSDHFGLRVDQKAELMFGVELRLRSRVSGGGVVCLRLAQPLQNGLIGTSQAKRSGLFSSY